MDKNVVQKILEVQDTLREDEEYRSLMEEHEVLNARFLEVVDALDEPQKAAIFDYLGLLTELHTKMLALACEEKSPEG